MLYLVKPYSPHIQKGRPRGVLLIYSCFLAYNSGKTAADNLRKPIAQNIWGKYILNQNALVYLLVKEGTRECQKIFPSVLEQSDNKRHNRVAHNNTRKHTQNSIQNAYYFYAFKRFADKESQKRIHKGQNYNCCKEGYYGYNRLIFD